MTQLFLIDGYNLMHRGYGPLRGDLESGRRALEKRLGRFLQLCADARILLVYDGVQGVNPTAVSGRSPPVYERLAWVYSEAPESADDRILQESARLAPATPHTVVTSDRKDIVRNLGRGVKTLSSEEFMMLVEDTLTTGEQTPRTRSGDSDGDSDNDGREKAEKPESVSASELDEWLAIFADVPAAPADADPAPSRPSPEPDPGGEKPSKLSPEEVADWMEQFGESSAERGEEDGDA